MTQVIESVNFTYWAGLHLTTGSFHSVAWRELGQWILGQHAATKAELPLIKLAHFNGTCEAVNLTMLYGIEAEHDAGTIQPEEAVTRLQAAGVTALIYTTPSSRTDAQRWRVLCPFAAPADPATLVNHLGRLAGALGNGVLAGESWTRGRRWYAGNASGGEPVRCLYTDGHPLDTLTGLPVVPPPHGAGGGGARRPLGDPALAAPSLDEAVRALNLIDPNTLSRANWIAVLAAFIGASVAVDPSGGMLAHGHWRMWCTRYDGDLPAEDDKEWRSIRSTSSGWAELQRRAGIIPELAAVTIPPGAPSQEVLAPITGAGLALLARNNTSGAPSALAVVEQLAEWHTPVAYNEFTDEITVTAPLSYAADRTAPRALKDADYTALICAFNANGEKPSLATVTGAVELYAKHRTFNPVTDYLNGLEWDGVARLDGWLATYLRVHSSEWTQLIGPKFLGGVDKFSRAFRR